MDGGGDCDSDAECLGDLVCMADAETGQLSGGGVDDYCGRSPTPCEPIVTWRGNLGCYPETPCADGEGEQGEDHEAGSSPAQQHVSGAVQHADQYG